MPLYLGSCYCIASAAPLTFFLYVSSRKVSVVHFVCGSWCVSLSPFLRFIETINRLLEKLRKIHTSKTRTLLAAACNFSTFYVILCDIVHFADSLIVHLAYLMDSRRHTIKSYAADSKGCIGLYTYVDFYRPQQISFKTKTDNEEIG